MSIQVGLKDFLTTGCAGLGAALGIINTVTSVNQRRVKLRVTPKMSVRNERGVLSNSSKLLPGSAPAVEVINLSAFPVTIAEAGFKLKGEKGGVVPHPPFVIDNKPWPRRLDSRESVTVHFWGNHSFPTNLDRAYATTDCEVTRHGDSPALKKFRARLQEEAYESGIYSSSRARRRAT
jgi:hypothetical protein